MLPVALRAGCVDCIGKIGPSCRSCPTSCGQLCVPPYRAAATLDTLLARVEHLTKLLTIIVPLFAAAALASGCASSDARYGGNDYRYGSVRSNERYDGVIDSIESGPVAVGREIGKANRQQDVYFIRVRFDDRSYQTETQASLDGLRAGDSVRIERGRVRRY
jgi:hypothetical protein